MYNEGGKFFSEIMSRHVNSLVCTRVKRGESECFRIETELRQGCVMYLWLFNVYIIIIIGIMSQRVALNSK